MGFGVSEYVIKPTQVKGVRVTAVVEFAGMPAFAGTVNYAGGVPFVEIEYDNEGHELTAPDDWRERITEVL